MGRMDSAATHSCRPLQQAPAGSSQETAIDVELRAEETSSP